MLSIAIGGALGAVSRYLVGGVLSKYLGSAWPWGTFGVNALGCFAMGLAMTLIMEKQVAPASWRMFICVGFLGGFTTFSSFGYEGLALMLKGELGAALAYVLGSVLLGLACCYAGIVVGRM